MADIEGNRRRIRKIMRVLAYVEWKDRGGGGVTPEDVRKFLEQAYSSPTPNQNQFLKRLLGRGLIKVKSRGYYGAGFRRFPKRYVVYGISSAGVSKLNRIRELMGVGEEEFLWVMEPGDDPYERWVSFSPMKGGVPSRRVNYG